MFKRVFLIKYVGFVNLFDASVNMTAVHILFLQYMGVNRS